jgi:hypothetical protein
MTEWRYHAARLNGDGTEEFLEYDLPVLGPKVTDQLSGPGGFTGRIAPEIARLRRAGKPVFEPWSTVIYAEASGQIRGGNLLQGFVEAGSELVLDCAGFTTYAVGEPYTSEWSRANVDPLVVAREIWSHLQNKPGADLGLRLDTTTSPVRIGTELQKQSVTTFDPKTKKSTTKTVEKVKPYALTWFETFDIGREFDQLARETPFDYRVEHAWSGEKVTHFMRLGYPTLGKRLHDLRFAVGENVYFLPDLEYDAEDYASEIVVLGSGEGRKRLRSKPARNPGARLHKAITIADDSLTTQAAVDAAARAEAKRRQGTVNLTSLAVLDHPHAPVGSYRVGDEVLVHTEDGWTDDLAVWVKVLEIENDPETGVSRLEVVRSEKA